MPVQAASLTRAPSSPSATTAACAGQADIAALHISNITHPEATDQDQAILTALRDHQVDLVITAGYMKKLGPLTLDYYRGKIINVHPSLLPRHGGHGMYGLRVHQAVIDNGDQQTGISVHWVETDYDTGPVIAQKIIAVAADDTAETLAAKVLDEEHTLLVSTLASLIQSPSLETNP